MKLFLLSLLMTLSASLFAQTDDFVAFARRQDSLMMDAYYQKDVASFQKNLDIFKKRYDKLNDVERSIYRGSLASNYYNFSCTYSLLNQNKEALTYLQLAVDNGYIEYYHIQQDTDLDNIRQEPEFLKMNAFLRNVGDYRHILKTGDAYDLAEKPEIPVFGYMPMDNENLAALRKAFNLDSIAGQGSTAFQAINLMHWIHYLIPHDGQHGNPEVRNAMNMIAECKRDDRGLNCRGLATVLNECYLSMGMKSRIVTCLPKDSLGIDSDCHVINTVWSPELNKWVWLDPTNDAYVMDEHGVMLSIQEVRDRLNNDQPLLLNPEANWNRIATNKEYYLETYMAKNLYILECPLVSEYNMETREPGRTFTYVRLIPTTYFKKEAAKTEEQSRDKTNTWITYNIHNPDLFWN